MNRIWVLLTTAVALAIALLSACTSTPDEPRRQIDVDTLISEIEAGHSLEGTELVVSGLALGARDPSGLVTLGSDDFRNFISVQGVEQPQIVHVGMPLTFSVLVQETHAVGSSYGKPVIMVNTTYQECISCNR